MPVSFAVFPVVLLSNIIQHLICVHQTEARLNNNNPFHTYYLFFFFLCNLPLDLSFLPFYKRSCRNLSTTHVLLLVKPLSSPMTNPHRQSTQRLQLLQQQQLLLTHRPKTINSTSTWETRQWFSS